uniref:Netrin module non-TIMP type domain-containing protein n=1 Tax=Eptatretus burgeri TaxID=7764 RepID=A0A8C4QDA0_EPTBU
MPHHVQTYLCIFNGHCSWPIPEFHCSNHYHPKMKVEDEAHRHGNISKCLQRHCVELKGMANESRNADRNHSAYQAEYGMNQTVSVGDRRSFVILMHCGKNLNVSPGDIYLVMGMHNTHWTNSDRTQYILNSDTWFEKFPLESVCRLPSPPASCQVSENFKQ